MNASLPLFLSAGLSLMLSSCGPYSREAAVVGGLLGAGAGAIVGNQSGRGLEGAAIGGAIGAGAGALYGSARDELYYGGGPYRYERPYYHGDYHHHAPVPYSYGYYDACPPPPPRCYRPPYHRHFRY